MIAAISLMRRRPDISMARFCRHWLDPHGVLTAGLPGVRFYVQHHPIDAPGSNALARELAIDGVPELWFDDYEQRRIAYTSTRIAECNVDSEQFVGAVTRLVTEPHVVAEPPSGSTVRVLLLATGAPDPGWSNRTEARVRALPGVTGYVRHVVLEQARAPNSRIPELKLAIGGVASVTFHSEKALATAEGALSGSGDDAARTAIYRVEDHVLV